MRATALFAAVGLCLFAAVPAVAYDTLEQDYAACINGGGKISSQEIVVACTRLIDNAATENEVVGYFHAMRMVNNGDSQQNCADAHKVLELVSDKTFIDGANQIIESNC